VAEVVAEGVIEGETAVVGRTIESALTKSTKITTAYNATMTMF
jgi:hypothetical protein